MTEGDDKCTVCHCEFNLDDEGGIKGFFGMIPVAFCPTCKVGIHDLAEIYWGDSGDD
jgi:hypothetical protein